MGIQPTKVGNPTKRRTYSTCKGTTYSKSVSEVKQNLQSEIRLKGNTWGGLSSPARQRTHPPVGKASQLKLVNLNQEPQPPSSAEPNEGEGGANLSHSHAVVATGIPELRKLERDTRLPEPRWKVCMRLCRS